MSQFGIIEMTRQRMRPSLKRSIYFDCPHCKGAGLVKTPESMSLDVMRRLAIASHDDRVVRLELSVHAEAAMYLTNRKRAALASLEYNTGKPITIRGDQTLAVDETKLELFDGRDGKIYLPELGMAPEPTPGSTSRRHQGQQPNRRGGRPDKTSRNQPGAPVRRREAAPMEEKFDLDRGEEAVDEREETREDESAIPAFTPPPPVKPRAQERPTSYTNFTDSDVDLGDDEEEDRQDEEHADHEIGEEQDADAQPQGRRDRPPQGQFQRRNDSGGQQRQNPQRQPEPRRDQRPDLRNQPRQDQGRPRQDQGRGDPSRQDSGRTGQGQPRQDQRHNQRPPQGQPRQDRNPQEYRRDQGAPRQDASNGQRPDNRQGQPPRDARQGQGPGQPQSDSRRDARPVPPQGQNLGEDGQPIGEQAPPADGSQPGGRRRRRRRGGRGRNRNRNRQEGLNEQQTGAPAGPQDEAGDQNQFAPESQDLYEQGQDQHDEEPSRDSIEEFGEVTAEIVEAHSEPTPVEDRQPDIESEAEPVVESPEPAIETKPQKGRRKAAAPKAAPARGRRGKKTAEPAETEAAVSPPKSSSRRKPAKPTKSTKAAGRASEVIVEAPIVEPVVRTGSTDSHQLILEESDEEPLVPSPVARSPRTYRDLDEIPDDLD